MNEAYLQAPLNLCAREIRLVKLEQSKNSEPIKCSLQQHKLGEECPDYVALSYTWGTKERHDDIQLNGVPFPVGHSLWSFLQQMRLQSRYITFWIDALSINQSNVLEQNHQVQMMRQIYSNAHSVWVWLGEADKDAHSDVAMEYLRNRESYPSGSNDSRQLWSPQQAKAMLALCERHYWRRIWIVQEVMLAKRLTILCGNKHVDWKQLQLLINDLRLMIDSGPVFNWERFDWMPNHSDREREVMNSPATAIIRTKSQWVGTPQPFHRLLKLYRKQQSTDIRDKVYALHGLACDSSFIEIDYRIDPEVLFLRLLYHFCSPQLAKKDTGCSKDDMIQFAKTMNEALQTFYADEVLYCHILVAREIGWARSTRNTSMTPAATTDGIKPAHLPFRRRGRYWTADIHYPDDCYHIFGGFNDYNQPSHGHLQVLRESGLVTKRDNEESLQIEWLRLERNGRYFSVLHRTGRRRSDEDLACKARRRIHHLQREIEHSRRMHAFIRKIDRLEAWQLLANSFDVKEEGMLDQLTATNVQCPEHQDDSILDEQLGRLARLEFDFYTLQQRKLEEIQILLEEDMSFRSITPLLRVLLLDLMMSVDYPDPTYNLMDTPSLAAAMRWGE
jgi:hypothetical protein